MWVSCVLVCFSFTACDTADPVAESTDEQLAEFTQSDIESVNVSPIAGKETTEYRIELRLQDNLRGVRVPDVINILAQGPGLDNVSIFDDGLGLDQQRGDGIFTGVIPSDCISKETQRGGAMPTYFTPGCKVQIVGPGGICGEWGKCPDRVHRSLFWGLIEYDTDVAVCICLVECTVEWGS